MNETREKGITELAARAPDRITFAKNNEDSERSIADETDLNRFNDQHLSVGDVVNDGIRDSLSSENTSDGGGNLPGTGIGEGGSGGPSDLDLLRSQPEMENWGDTPAEIIGGNLSREATSDGVGSSPEGGDHGRDLSDLVRRSSDDLLQRQPEKEHLADSKPPARNSESSYQTNHNIPRASRHAHMHDGNTRSKYPVFVQNQLSQDKSRAKKKVGVKHDRTWYKTEGLESLADPPGLARERGEPNEQPTTEDSVSRPGAFTVYSAPSQPSLYPTVPLASDITTRQSHGEAVDLGFEHAIMVEAHEEESGLSESARGEMLANAMEQARAEIVLNSVTAEVVRNSYCPVKCPSSSPKKKNRALAIVCCFVILVASIIAVPMVVVGRNDDNSDASMNAEGMGADVPDSTFAALKERGVLRCGLNSAWRAQWAGFYIDICRALAAAALGSPDLMEPVPVSAQDRWSFLSSGGADVIIRGDTHTFQRDIYQPDTGEGFTFSIPYFYDGLSFAGLPEYVACAENSDTTGDCSSLRVCVGTGTSWLGVVSSMLPATSIVETTSVGIGYFKRLTSGECNAVAGEQSIVSIQTARGHGYTGNYVVGSAILSKEPLAAVTRHNDAQWSDLVNAVLQGLLLAEKGNITQSTAATTTTLSSTSTFFGGKYSSMIHDAVAAVGNYNEIYDRHLQGAVSRQPINFLNTGESGLLFAHPFGDTTIEGPGPVEGGLLGRILARGHLRCGVMTKSILGLAKSSPANNSNSRIGLDVDVCAAVAAALFEGASENIVIKEMSSAEYGLNAVSGRDIDVFSGPCISLDETGPEEGKSNCRGLSLSQPYFYESTTTSSADSSGGAHRLMTRQDDLQFPTFVYWVVAALFYAEEAGITQTTANQMPVVNLYGSAFARMFRDAVGSYGEAYEKNEARVDSIPPRGGRNLQNSNPYGPQHYPFIL